MGAPLRLEFRNEKDGEGLRVRLVVINGQAASIPIRFRGVLTRGSTLFRKP